MTNQINPTTPITQLNEATWEALEITSKYVSALSARDSQILDDLRSPDFILDFVFRDAQQTRPLTKEDTNTFWPSWFRSFTEHDYEVIRTIASDRVVVTEWVFTGTHSQPIDPPVFSELVEPTGRTIRFRGVSIYDVDDGLIQRETLYMDLATLMVELGIQP